MTNPRPGTVLLIGLMALPLLSVVARAAAAPRPAEAAAADRMTLDVEQVFWRQPAEVSRAAGRLAPPRDGHADVYFVGFAGDDSQEIFAREVRAAAAAVAERLDPPGRSMLLLNNRAANAAGVPIASLGTLQLTLEELASRLDPAEDILFLYLASHGLPSHELYVANGELPLEQVSPSRLREVLDRHGFHRRIVVVSACFSGDFARELAGDSTVVLTAARADRPSFGCRDSRGMTYFGEALWQYALPRAESLEQAFAMARTRVDEMERAAQLAPSEPQMRVGAAAREWFTQLLLRPTGSSLAGVQDEQRSGDGAARALLALQPVSPLRD